MAWVPYALAGLWVIGKGLEIGAGVAEAKTMGKVARENIAQGERDIKYIKGQTIATVGDIEKGGAEFLHRQRAAIGAAGVKLTGGSPLLLLQETETKIAKDIRRLKLSSKHEIERIKSAGGQYKTMAEGALWQGILGGGSTFLTGLGQGYTSGSLLGWW